MIRVMTETITTEELHDDDGQPATRRDLRRLEQRMATKLDQLSDKNLKKLAEQHRAFLVALEDAEDRIKGANGDEVSLLKDKDADHEERLTAVEHKIGLR